jgi:cadherin 23
MKNFTVDQMTGRVRPTTPIDFEKLPGNSQNGVRAMNLVVRAQDRGLPKALYSEVSLTIYIQDVNDHAPRFEKLHYATNIAEDLAGGSPVLQVCVIIIIFIFAKNNFFFAPFLLKFLIT